MNVGLIKEYVRFLRLKAWGVSTIAVIGAISAKGTIDVFDFIVLFSICVIYNVLGFVLNDYVDYDIDRKSKDLSQRPLVKKTISKKTALGIIILSYFLIIFLSIVFYPKILALSFLAISLVLGTIYDCFGKRFLGSDLTLSASVAFLCLFGAATVSSDIKMITIIISCIYFMHVLFFNIIEGGFKDADNDRLQGAKTTASFLGVNNHPEIFVPIKFKILAFTLEFITAVFVFIPFFVFSEIFEFDFWYVQIIVLLILTISLFITVRKMLNLKVFHRKKITILITKQEVKRYMIIPFILLSFCDIIWLIFILLLPTLWYFSFIVIFREKPFKSKLL